MKFLKILFGLAAATITFLSFLVPDAAYFPDPALARIFIFHFPCPMAATWFMVAGAYLSFRYLRSLDPKWDVRAVAANEVGLMFGLLVMATGVIFSKAQWGAWWQWDPRQTSFLLVLLIYMAYFVLRSGFADANKRAAFSAAYAVAAFLPNMFLIFVFPRLPQVMSFHPTDTIARGKLDLYYGSAVLGTLFVILTLSFWMYRLRVRAGLLELALEEIDGELETHRGPAAPTGVVRPVSVPDEG